MLLKQKRPSLPRNVALGTFGELLIAFSIKVKVFLINCNLLRVVYDRIARAFNRSDATRAVTLDISKAFDRVWHVGLLHELKSYGISCQIFGRISSFLSSRRFWVVLDGKSSQEYPVNAGVPQGSILGHTLVDFNA